jgi:hypothetical protein
MKALAIGMVVGAALCSVVAVPASAMPTSNVAAAASDLAPSQSVRYNRYYQYRDSSSGYPGYTDNCNGYGFGPSSPCYP